jgi:aspartate/methionine/tyrosine aminotransferase
MKIAPFATEHFFARYEFTTPYQLCNSDCETMTVDELLALAGIPLAELGNLALGYTESQGNPELRRLIASHYETVTPDDVVVLGSPIEGIYLAARTLLQPGDEVIVLSPAYDALTNMFAHIVGADGVKQWAFTETADGWRLDFAQLDALLTPRTRLLVVNFPHNPTGYLPTRAQLDALAAFVEANDLWLFYDEMYFGLVHSGTPAIPSAADVTQRAVVLSGLSKTYGMPGLRTGWLIVPDEALRQEIVNWKFYTSICPPAPSEFLAMAALRASDAIRERNLAIIERNRDLFAAFVARWDDLFVWSPPLAGSTSLVRVNVPSVTELGARLAEEAGVLIHPATTLGGSDQHMRIGLGRAAFPAALAQFETYLQQKGIS